MKKLIACCLILLGLVFVACGKEKGIGELVDKEKISSEYNIKKEDETHLQFSDKNEDNPEIFRIFSIEKMPKVEYKTPQKLDKIEEFYIEHDWETIYKDEQTLIVCYEDKDTKDYEYNIHIFDDSKTELSITVSVGATRKVSKDELFDMLKEAKEFIKK